MEDTYNAEMGHNNPPSEDTRSPAQKRVDDLMAAANTWLSTVTEITDAETAKACDDFLQQVKDEAAALETERKAFNKPLEDQVKTNNDSFRPLTALLAKAKDLLTPLKTKWLKREQDRIAAEKKAAEDEALRKLQAAEDARRAAATSVQAAVQADEAQRAADTAMVAFEAVSKAKAQVKGDWVPRSSGLRTYWSAVVIDQRKAVNHYVDHPKMVVLVQELANADAREMKDKLDIPGVQPKSEERAV